MLKPRDVLVAVALLDAGPDDKGYARVAARLGISASEAHAALDRAALSGLVDRKTRTLRRAALREFLLHGLKYCFPGERTGVTRGVPTSIAAPPLREHFPAEALPPVWPHLEGTQRGEGLVPLYRSVPEVARRVATKGSTSGLRCSTPSGQGGPENGSWPRRRSSGEPRDCVGGVRPRGPAPRRGSTRAERARRSGPK